MKCRTAVLCLSAVFFSTITMTVCIEDTLEDNYENIETDRNDGDNIKVAVEKCEDDNSSCVTSSDEKFSWNNFEDDEYDNDDDDDCKDCNHTYVGKKEQSYNEYLNRDAFMTEVEDADKPYTSLELLKENTESTSRNVNNRIKRHFDS